MNLDIVRQAAREGLKRVRTASGQQVDDDLAMYQRLRPGDFPKLIQKYGTEETLAYISAMEKRMKEGSHA